MKYFNAIFGLGLLAASVVAEIYRGTVRVPRNDCAFHICDNPQTFEITGSTGKCELKYNGSLPYICNLEDHADIYVDWECYTFEGDLPNGE